MDSIEYLKMGQYDFFEKVQIAPDGRFVVEFGTYKSARPRSGRLVEEKRSTLRSLLEDLPAEFNDCRGEVAFTSRIVVGEGTRRREFWVRPGSVVPRQIGQLVSFLREI